MSHASYMYIIPSHLPGEIRVQLSRMRFVGVHTRTQLGHTTRRENIWPLVTQFVHSYRANMYTHTQTHAEFVYTTPSDIPGRS